MSVVGFGPLEFLRPSMSDVLDGRTAANDRQEAIDAVNAGMDSASIPGTSEAGRHVYTWCVRGQNNWKVRDGFRLKCGATGRVFSAWTGEFESVRSEARKAILARCDGPAGPLVKHVPSPQWETEPEQYECSDGTTINLVFASTIGLSDTDSIVYQAFDSDHSRYISGANSTELVEGLSGEQWFAVQSVERIYYED